MNIKKYFILKNYVTFLKDKLFRKDYKITYSQFGEDLLIDLAIQFLGIKNPTYLDIGAHHPTRLSNTFLLYKNKSHGVCIEPNPNLAKLFKKTRPRDTLLEIAIGPTRGSTTLFMVSDNSLSTISRTQAEYFLGESKHNIAKEVQVQVSTIMDIINQYFKSAPPDIISLDIEGVDLDVLKSFNFKICQPPVFCIETLTYNESDDVQKIPEIIEFMTANGYFIFADTYLNTIFINKKIWENK